MELEDIKQKALELKNLDNTTLNNQVSELKNAGVSFLGCVAFVQANQDISLSEARTKTLELNCWTTKENEEIDYYHKLMLGEFDDDE